MLNNVVNAIQCLQRKVVSPSLDHYKFLTIVPSRIDPYTSRQESTHTKKIVWRSFKILTRGHNVFNVRSRFVRHEPQDRKDDEPREDAGE